MIADFDFARSREFMVKEAGDFVLIRPLPSKHVWQEDELWYRSLLCRKNGEVVSCGLGKFFNHSEYAPHTETFNAIVRNGGEVYFPEKLDGSLIIRAVIDGKVHWRTRGSSEMQLGDDEGIGFDGTTVLRLVQTKYPELADPCYSSRHSLLFEYVGPGNQIVMRYDEPELYSLGMITHEDDVPCLVPSFDYHYRGRYPRPRCFDLNLFDEKKIISEVSTWQDREGVVAYARQSPTDPWVLVKIKASRYLQLHAFKYQMSQQRFRCMMWENHIIDMDAFETFMLENSYDYELIEYARPMFVEYVYDWRDADRRYLNCAMLLRDPTTPAIRKEQVERIRALVALNDTRLSTDFSYWINVLDGKYDLCVGSEVLGMTPSEYRGMYPRGRSVA